jgi:hypothetical protein
VYGWTVVEFRYATRIGRMWLFYDKIWWMIRYDKI